MKGGEGGGMKSLALKVSTRLNQRDEIVDVIYEKLINRVA